MNMNRSGRSGMRFGMVWAGLVAAAVGSFAQAPANSYVGSEPCRTCHPNQWATFYKNPHFKSLASGKETPERTGCESCHGPGQRHVEQRGGKSSIVAFSCPGETNSIPYFGIPM